MLQSRIFRLKWSHFANFRENVATIKDSSEKLRQLDGVEREFGVIAQLSDVQPGSLCNAGFHMPCYRRFTDKIKIARSVKRCAKVSQPSHGSFIDVHTSWESVRNV